MKKTCFILAFVFIFQILSIIIVSATAATVSSAYPLDVNQQIRGRVAPFTLDVPLAWRRHIEVQREFFQNPQPILERIMFHYRPSDLSASRTLLLEIAVFNRDDWRENLGYTRLTETDNHVLALRTAPSNPFVFGADRLLFDNMLRDASNPAFLISYISVPAGGDTVVRNTVSVNGKRMSSPSVMNTLRVVFVPVREVAESLGYTVNWDSASGNITISSGTFFTTLVRDTNIRQRHHIVNIDGISYVSTMFFLQVMQCNVEIDEHSNVRISREVRR